ncbi:TetR family transcriptional regulator [Longimycelium tulufanense]|uniref:TetR family transcriptional regulator n=2 Tax=Longimycelium tulufanense TaxID=907463 RepID=A0A8J3C7Z7_9PSEU|nr:TetR family transcriptional regulator [Longimycelium tulufanense]
MDVSARRHQLLEVGCELFASQPYDEVWIDHVAARAGVSRGLLYHYFGSKRDFLRAIVEHEAAALLAATEPDPDLPPPEQLRAALDGYLDYVANHPHGYRAIYRGTASTDAQVRTIIDNNLRQQEQRLLTALTYGESPSERLRLAIHGWIAFVVATCLDWLDNPTLDATAIRDLCADALTGILTTGNHLFRAR